MKEKFNMGGADMPQQEKGSKVERSEVWPEGTSPETHFLTEINGNMVALPKNLKGPLFELDSVESIDWGQLANAKIKGTLYFDNLESVTSLEELRHIGNDLDLESAYNDSEDGGI